MDRLEESVATAAQDLPDPDWHALEAGQVLDRMATDWQQGLGGGAVRERLARHGPNALPSPPAAPWWKTFARQFRSPLIYLLFVAAGLALGLGHHSDAVVILVVVLVNAAIGSFQEGRAERSMAALRRLSELRVRVRRDGADHEVEARELVPGDILLLAAGDAVGADARLLAQTQLQVAEAALTGESVPVTKAVAVLPESTALAERRCMVYSGTQVTAGRAEAVVVATGRHTEVGRIAGLTEAAEEPTTPLEHRLERFGRTLLGAALALFVVVALLGLWRDLPLADVLMVAISQMVSVVPEGLPVAMTIALAVGMQRMASRGAIVRRLAAVETLGSTTVICSDKTGTLTRNEMTAAAVWLPVEGQGARVLEVGGIGYAPAGALTEHGRAVDAGDPALAALLQAAVLCNDAELVAPEDGSGAWTVLGDPTEAALLVLARKAGLEPARLRHGGPREAEWPFDAEAKLMATRHRLPDGPRRVFVKGAPEAVLRLLPLQEGSTKRLAQEAADALAQQALRVLAFAVIEDDPLDDPAGFAALAGRARLLGMVGEIDPPREEARQAVAQCRAAGIRPVMVTGDHKLTGLAIARALGIAGAEARGVDGAELERMPEAELRDKLPGIAVFARVQPAQKMRIVEALQARGDVVAMTGDGVNDAPALARSDVGVAMGITGTEVAKEAADIVVTDDNFATIVGAVEQGRLVYGNLKKLILFLFATSVDEILVLLLALLAGWPLPLAAVQILWINLVTEGTLTVNLVMEPSDGDEMRRRPVPRGDPLIDAAMLRRVVLMAGTSAAVALGWLAWRLPQGLPLDMVRTEVFTLVAVCQWFNVLNCRSATRSALGARALGNAWLLGGLAASVALQLLVLYTPWMNALFHTVPLEPATLLLLVGLASSVLWVEEARKLLARRRVRGQA